MRALITGASGFVGSHLIGHLLQQGGWEVYALCWAGCSTENLDAIRSQVTMIHGDLMEPAWVDEVIANVCPEAIFHLAALSSPSASFNDPAGTFTNNVVGQVHLFEAVRKAGGDPVVLVIGSGEEYGMVRPDEVPVSEDAPLRPANPYAVSKVAQDFMGLQYFLSHHIRAVRVRPFNHIGPRQALGFVTSDFAQQIAAIEAGSRPPVLSVGNLSARRDFTDVRDMVKAYTLAVTQGQPGEVYNLGSGRAYSIKEILQTLIGLCRVPVRVEQDPQRMRPSDVPVLVCDSTRFHQQTGWEASIPIEQSLRDILDYWRGKSQIGKI